LLKGDKMTRQDDFDARVYSTIRQDGIKPQITLKELFNLGYLSTRGVAARSESFERDPIPLNVSDLEGLITWGIEQHGFLGEMAEQLRAFRGDSSYDGNLKIEDMEPVYKGIRTHKMRAAAPEEKLKERAFWLLVADYVAYTGQQIKVKS
jgi:hypothetical protein